MSNGKSPGPSFIMAELLKILPDNLVDVISILFNRLFKELKIPSSWELIRLSLIKKNNNEYRPIGITNQLRKLFEKILLTRLETKCIFSKQQGGFQRYIGTQNHALVLDNMLRRSNGQAIAVALDLRKAYDTVDRKVLYCKLVNKFNFSAAEVTLLFSLLENNEVEIVQAELRKTKHLTLGLPQGCVLSPVLFNAFIDDIVEYIEPRLRNKILIYADDILLISTIPSEIENIIRQVEKHSRDNNYKLNPTKCKIMTNCTSELRICGSILERVSKIKYLGYMYNLKGLDVDGNVDIIKSKIFGRAAMIKRFVTCPKIVNGMHINTPKILLNAYKTYCRPLIDFPLALMATFKYTREKCEAIQRGLLKYMLGLNHRVPTSILYGIIDIEKVDYRGLVLTNNLRLRSEKLCKELLYKKCYDENNTRILSFIKTTKEVHDLIYGKKQIKDHVKRNKVVDGFNIECFSNKKLFDKFIFEINNKVVDNRESEELEDILIKYIILMKEKMYI